MDHSDERPKTTRHPQSFPTHEPELTAPSTDGFQPPVEAQTGVRWGPESEPEIRTSWLHPSSLIFDLISHSRELIVPIVIAIFSAASGSPWGLVFALAFFVPAAMFSVFRYFTLRYNIDQGELVVKQGLIFRRVRTVPIKRIQNIDLVQNPLHRLFRVAEVRIETASGTEPEAVLRVLSMHKIAELREHVFADAIQASSGRPEDTTDRLPELDPVGPGTRRENGVSLLQIPTSWLLKAGLASNRGMLLIGVLYGAWYQFDLEDKIDLDRLKKALPSLDGTVLNTLKIIGLALAVLLFLRLLSVIWYLLRFSGYRLTLHGEDLRISCGLFTRVSATVPRNRIQLISIHRPLLLRWLGLAAIRIETAGGGGMSDNPTTTVSRRWFVPVIPEDRVSELVAWLRPGLDWNEAALDWRPLAPGTARRLMRKAFLAALLLTAVGLAITRPWGGLAGLATLPLLLWWARKKSRAMRYARTGDFVVFRSGILNRKTSLTFWDKVQNVSVTQTPFDRRWKMATLSVDTAASGPADHRVSVSYLDDAFARQEFSSILSVASRHQPDFG